FLLPCSDGSSSDLLASAKRIIHFGFMACKRSTLHKCRDLGSQGRQHFSPTSEAAVEVEATHAGRSGTPARSAAQRPPRLARVIKDFLLSATMLSGYCGGCFQSDSRADYPARGRPCP